MHGCGNDYIYVNAFTESVSDPAAAAIRLSDRHFGIGGDGLVLIRPSEQADFFMDMYNADGSRSEMCGNAIRCVGKYVHDRGLTDKTVLTIETLAGIKTLWLTLENGSVRTVRVNMGHPRFHAHDIPVASNSHRFFHQPVEVGGETWEIHAVNTGNPHGVIVCDDPDALPLEQIGPVLEHHPYFPERANIEFIRVLDRRTIQMRVWERGSGETLACGTGACASVAIAVGLGLTDTNVDVRLKGGTLHIDWDNVQEGMFMTGPAEFVFDGEVDI